MFGCGRLTERTLYIVFNGDLHFWYVNDSQIVVQSMAISFQAYEKKTAMVHT